MALLTMDYYLLFLLSLILLDATHGDLCGQGSYCPAGVDCNNNSSLCKVGECEATTGESCVRDISLEFESSSYDVNENHGPAQPALILDGPLECCYISVRVKVEDITAKGGEDYDIPPNQYVQVIFPPGETTVSFDVLVIDDIQMENSETFRVTIYDLSVPYGITLGSITSAEITILDNDSTTLSFSKATFYVKENEGPAQPELTLSVPALFDINVVITGVNNLAGRCNNFQSGPFEVIFPNGTTRVNFSVNITDDDVYEVNESFNLVIVTNLPTLVNLGHPNKAAITIVDDEKPIKASFEENVYKVHEHQGSIAPVIKLSEPSPCCFILRVQLNNDTAHGRTIDYGYALPKIYNYTFHAGSTCASPDANITITDDMISEKEEKFEVSIIEDALPFGVETDGIATIIINDNDNAVSFKFKDHGFREDEWQMFFELILESPPSNDLVIRVNSHSDTATGGDDYTSGPYDVVFQSGRTKAYLFIALHDDKMYEGDEYFNATISSSLPHGVVRAHPYTANVKIEDDEYTVCFKECDYTVEEGADITLDLTLSRSLHNRHTVELKYDDLTASSRSDYHASSRYVNFNSGSTEVSFTISTREDTVLEDKRETFKVTILSQPSSDCCTEANVTILDDDGITIKFDSDEYRGVRQLPARPRLKLNKTPTMRIRVTIEEMDGTAIGGVDYENQHYRNLVFEIGGDTYLDLPTKRINDDLVEGSEFYYLRIEPATLPERVTAVSPSTTKIVLLDDDVTIVTRQGNVVSFSKAIDHAMNMTATYYNANSETLTLLPGDKQIKFTSTAAIQRITIAGDCNLNSRHFSIRRGSRVYVIFSHC